MTETPWLPVVALLATLVACVPPGGSIDDDDCAEGEVLCGETCTDLASDPQSCGACGTWCGDEASCIEGVCACPAGEVACGYECADLATDADHCGACAAACGSGSECTGAACTPCGARDGACCRDGTCESAALLSCEAEKCEVLTGAEPFPTYTPYGACTRATWSCIFGCSSVGCVRDCIADDEANLRGGWTCADCIAVQWWDCANHNECAEAVEMVRDCIATSCTTGDGPLPCAACVEQERALTQCQDDRARFYTDSWTSECFQ